MAEASRVGAAAAGAGGGAPSAAALTWSDKENAYKCAHCRAPTPVLNLRCRDCGAVTYCGDACKRADAGAHARACKGLLASRFAFTLGLAEKDDAGALFNVGIAYEFGRGVEQSDTEAATWYRRAADKGHAGARYNLANLYRDGRGGLPVDLAEKVRYLHFAAAQGYARAESELGASFWNGTGVLHSAFATLLVPGASLFYPAPTPPGPAPTPCSSSKCGPKRSVAARRAAPAAAATAAPSC